jgi:hypothetical protein
MFPAIWRLDRNSRGFANSRSKHYIDGIMTLDLIEHGKLVLAALLTRTIEDDHLPVTSTWHLQIDGKRDGLSDTR